MEFLAHRDKKSGRTQSVAQHCRAVSRLCRESGKRIGMASAAELIGLLHDAGKAKQEFQRYLELDDLSLRGSVNHSCCGARFLYESYQNGAFFEQISSQLAALVICSHHRGLVDCIDPHGKNGLEGKVHPSKEIHYEESLANFLAQCAGRGELARLAAQSANEVERLIEKLCRVFPGTNHEQRIFALGLVVRYLFSCLIDADRWDTYLFSTDQSPPPGSDPVPLWEELSTRLEAYLAALPPGGEINRLRREISSACLAFARKPAGVYQLYVPTGGGKTLSSLRYALHTARLHGKQRIFYIIPFKTIIDQNAGEIRSILKRDDVILEHHSDVVRDDEDERRKLLTERWDAPIVLTTMVQFLNTLFDGGTQAARRMHSLADSVIILDEIQSLPVRCVSMFNSAVNFLSRICGCSVVLCTATQPQFSSPDLPEPLILGNPAHMIGDVEEKFVQFRRTRIVDARVPRGYDAPSLADYVLDKGRERPSVLIVLNTKRSVRELFEQLKARNEALPAEERYFLCHLSTGMCPAHRIEVIGGLRRRLEANERVLCVSTQLIEAGVDLSFTCVVRSLAGLDSIAQAAGRCNRHGEAPCREVYLVNDAGESLSKLPDIQQGQKATEQVLDEFAQNPAAFGGDLLCPKAIERYYFYYFYKRRAEMGYPVTQEEDRLRKLPTNVELYDLLSMNDVGKKAMGKQPVTMIKQAFATAGRLFQAIESDARPVLVPYGEEGKELLRRIEGETNLSELTALLRQAQRFAVNLFAGEWRQLDKSHALRPLEALGITLLEEGHYDEAYGVRAEYQTEPIFT